MATDTISQPNAKTFTPEEIVAEVTAGRVRVPQFQRKFRWRWEDVKRLFDSIVKGYPIGNLLLWERAASKDLVRIGALSIDAPAGTALWVVDGQQRVTSLANALTEEGSQDPTFALAFDLEIEEFSKLEPDSAPPLVPLHIIFDLEKLLDWFAEHPEQKPWLQRATRVAKAIRQYNIPAYVVKQQDEDVLRDIFDRMNNYGRRLSRAEIFSALHGGQSRSGTNVHFSDIAEDVDTVTGFGRLDDDTALRAVLARRGPDVARDIRSEFDKDSVTRDFAGESKDVAHQEGQAALERAVQFLQRIAGVPHFGFLPYRYLIVVLTRFFAHFPKPTQRNEILLRRFFWRAALAGPNIVRGSWTGAMRAYAGKITAGDESGSVQRLLAMFSGRELDVPRLTSFRTNTAETRIILCALWSLGPRSPENGKAYDVEALASTLKGEIAATNALRMFFPRASDPSRVWAANRAILLDEVTDEVGATFEGVTQFSPKVRASILQSHALDKPMLELLEEQKTEPFLQARQERLMVVVRSFIESMTESKFEDTPPLDELSLDEDEEKGRDDDALE
jgi:Protein of unknown function DUF262